MNRYETNKYNMFKAVNAVFEQNSSVTTEYPALGEALTGFNSVIAEIDATDKKYITSTDGKTVTKNLLEDELIGEVLPVKSALYAYAVKTKNEELKVLTVESESALKRMRDPEFLRKAELIKAEAQKHLADLAPYKISEATLAELQEKIEAFGAALGGKDTGFANKSALRKALTEKFDAADGILTEQMDTLIELIRKNNTLFYNQYFAARVIKDLGMGKKVEEKPAETITEPGK
ncbi:MAG: hypothetical protein FD122_3693 [Stygiobacter sp.]|nr:MAG: hypothetical protein FD122_3693 [Stygiobacter sp.]KAF0213240.1 MAG: hypothetical protein FD178_2953 [Ignavibacteria bacterium]